MNQRHHPFTGTALLAATVLAVALTACSGGASDDTATTTTLSADTTTATEVVDLETLVDDDTIAVLDVIGIDGDELFGDYDPEYQDEWDRFAALFPYETRPEVVAYVPIDENESDGTDGAMQTNANDASVYYIALDVTVDTSEELDRTMIHEYAHLMTLRPSQIPIDEDAFESCPVYSGNYSGCPIEGAYLRTFVDLFWHGYLIEDEDAETDESRDARYSEDEFVTDYAATNPSEDIAEVFAEWVLADEPATGDTIVAQKLRFFDDYPEVVALRLDIREALGY